MIIIDGIEWSYPCDITRVSEIKPSDISGMLLDGSWFNDVVGTYLQYTIKLVVPLDARDEYSTIYEAITAPVDAHTLVLPYNQGTVSITGRVESINDVYVRLANGGIYWRGISFTVISSAPTKQQTLEGTLLRGRTPLPELVSVSIGDAYYYTSNGWLQLPDGDELEY